MINRKRNIFLLLVLILLMMIAISTNAASQSLPGYQEYSQLDIGIILCDGTKAPIQDLLNSKILIKGKILKSPQLKSDEVVVYRMVITCCAADALPSGVVVKLPEKTQFHDEDWVGVEGTIQLVPFDEKLKTIEPVTNMVPEGSAYPYLTATKAYKISAPATEYLYY